MNSRIAVRYANSLYQLGEQNNSLSGILSDIQHLQILLTNPEFVSMLQSPIIHKTTKKAILQKISSGYSNETSNLFAIMADKRREAEIVNLPAAFLTIYNQKNNITHAEIFSSTKLDDNTLSVIKQFVLSKTNAKEVSISASVDQNLIGGLMIMFDGKLYDTSISSQIKNIKKELKIA